MSKLVNETVEYLNSTTLAENVHLNKLKKDGLRELSSDKFIKSLLQSLEKLGIKKVSGEVEDVDGEEEERINIDLKNGMSIYIELPPYEDEFTFEILDGQKTVKSSTIPMNSSTSVKPFIKLIEKR